MMLRAIPIFFALMIGFEPLAPRRPTHRIDVEAFLGQMSLGMAAAEPIMEPYRPIVVFLSALVP